MNHSNDCSIVNGEISYPFEGEISTVTGTEIVSISANGTGGLCPTDLAAFDYQIVNGQVQFSGIVQALNPECEWGDIELTIETDKACCTLVIPFSYPKPCDDVECLESAPAIEGIFGHSNGNQVIISVPGSNGIVIIKDNLTGKTSTQSIGKVECGPYSLDKWGNWTGHECSGFSYRVDYDCTPKEGEEKVNSLYDFTIIVGECEYRFVGDYCDETVLGNPKEHDDEIGGRSSADETSNEAFSVVIYPNPSSADSDITIESSEPIKQVLVYDMNGMILSTQVLNELSERVILRNSTEFSNGLYLVKIISSTDKTEYKKLIVQNN